MATLSKEDKELFNFIINDPQSTEEEKKSAREVLKEFGGEKTTSTKKATPKKTTAKKTATKKTTTKSNMSDLEKKKAEIKKRTGKTLEECEKIIEQYKALKSSDATQKKKATTQKVQAKKRTTKLKKEGKVIKGTTEKNAEATLNTATKKVVKKLDKQVDKIQKTSKTEKQVEKKIDTLVTKAVRSNKKLFTDTAKEIAKVDKNNAKEYLLSLKKEIDTLLKKYEYGGMLPSNFGQAGLVGETGAMNEVDLFAMGGTLPQGVHQYYAQTYNPAYPTPHGYAKGGKVGNYTSDDLPNFLDKIFGKDFIENVLIQKDQMDINFKDDGFFVGQSDIKAVEKKGWNFDSLSTYGTSGISLLFTRKSYAKGGSIPQSAKDEFYQLRADDMGFADQYGEDDLQEWYEEQGRFAKGGMITSAPEYHKVRNAEYDRRVKSGKIKDTDDNFERFDRMYFDELVDKGRIDPDNYFAKGGEIDENKAHYSINQDNQIYVDSNFINMSQNALPNSKLEHLGFGDFYLETPNGTVQFIRTDFKIKGFVGRTHRLGGFSNVALDLLDAMKSKSQQVSGERFAKGGMTENKNSQIIAEIEEIKSEITERPPYVYEREGQIKLSSEEGDEFSDYYGEFYEPMYVDERLEAIADKYNSYWEWENAGTLVLVQEFAKGGYIAKYQGKSLDVQAKSLYEAKQKAIKELKVPKSKQGTLAIMSKDAYDNEEFRFMAKGGKTQGYNDKLDESLGNTKGKRSTKEQNYKDRRNESEAMEKKGGKRKYASVKTMDKGKRKKRKTPMTLAKAIRRDGEKWQDAVKRATMMMKKEK